jgi:hypothetical protein
MRRKKARSWKMKLEYKLFGKVATLVRYRRVAVEGDRVTLRCEGAERCRLYLERNKVSNDAKLIGGEAEIPVKWLEGGASITFYRGDGSDAWGTPLRLERVGGTVYAVGGEFSQREEIERLNDALVYAVEVVEAAQKEASRVAELEVRLERLEKRANSGDIINF